MPLKIMYTFALKSGNVLPMLMKVIWLLRQSLCEIQLLALLLFHYRCLWWSCCLSIRAWGLGGSNRAKQRANGTVGADVDGRRCVFGLDWVGREWVDMQRRFHSIVTKICNEFKQLVVVIPVFISFAAGVCCSLLPRSYTPVAFSNSCEKNTSSSELSVLLSCLLYSLFFMLHLSIWNVGGTYRILNKLWMKGEWKKERLETVVRCTNV